MFELIITNKVLSDLVIFTSNLVVLATIALSFHVHSHFQLVKVLNKKPKYSSFYTHYYIELAN